MPARMPGIMLARGGRMVDTLPQRMKLLRRNLSLMLAVRYLNPLRSMFSIITLICLAGVALGVTALIVVLSVMEGLQNEMESRVLAFAPHFVIDQHDGFQHLGISDEQVDWPALQEKLSSIPGVVSVYPMLESDAFAQSGSGRITVRFNAVEPHNDSQLQPLLPMLKEGTFDFGEGLNEECVVSATTARSLGLGIGDSLHITPVGSIDEIADIWAMIQEPMLTQENKEFKEASSTFFDGSAAAEDGSRTVAREKVDRMLGVLFNIPAKKLRKSEQEALDILFQIIQSREEGTPYSAEDQKRWNDTLAGLAALDRDKEDGKAVKGINQMVMPVDLTIVGIYQPPENMPGPNVYMPLQIAQDMLGLSTGGKSVVHGICVRVQDANNPGPIESRLREMLPPPMEPCAEYPTGRQWDIIPWSRRFEEWHQLIANERVMMGFVLSVISLIASFCIMAVMFTVSMQRKREIAVLQAMGATPAKIMGIFTWQGVIIGFFGAVLGVLLAILTLHYRLEIQAAMASVGMDPFPMEAHGITLPAVYDPAMFAWQAFKAFLMVTAASIIPAFLVARQDPAKALRSN